MAVRTATGTVLDQPLPRRRRQQRRRRKWRPSTWDTNRDALGYYVGWRNLENQGADLGPDFCTKSLIEAYVAYMLERVSRSTIRNRIDGLYYALRKLDPGFDWHFPGNDCRMATGSRLREAASTHPTSATAHQVWPPADGICRARSLFLPQKNAALYRDGLLIAGNAWRALRRGNYSGLRIDVDFRQIGDDWWFVFDEDAMKNGEPLLEIWPHELRNELGRYLSYWRLILAVPPLSRRVASVYGGEKETGSTSTATPISDWPNVISCRWHSLRMKQTDANPISGAWCDTTWDINTECLGRYIHWVTRVIAIDERTSLDALFTHALIQQFAAYQGTLVNASSARMRVLGIERALATLSPEAYVAYWNHLIKTADAGDHIWLTYQGRPMSGKTYYVAIIRRTTAVFDEPVNPQMIRVSRATCIADEDPVNAHDAASQLTHEKFGTTEKSYILTRRAPAFEQLAASRLALRDGNPPRW